MNDETLDKALYFSLIIIGVAYLLKLAEYVIQRTVALLPQATQLKLTHLGSGTFKTSPTEETIFEYTKNEPFTISGYVNLKNINENDTIILKEYIKLSIDGEYTLYAKEEYSGKLEQPLIRIKKLPAMKGVKITIQQTKGTAKYVPWEFYAGYVG